MSHDPTERHPQHLHEGCEEESQEYADENEEPSAGDPLVLSFEIDIQQRLWLKAILPLIQLRSGEVDPNGRVQFAFDRMCIAACERISRILRSDLAEEPESGGYA